MSGLVDKGAALASSGAVQGMRLVRVADFSAPLSLSDVDRPSYVRRFVTLFVSQGQGHRGGTGRVEHARNAQGEHLALKLLSLPHRRDGETEEDHARRVRASRAAFEREYECHILLSGLKGFPRLYGRGTVDGVPCIVMEWVEGITLDRVRRQLAVDGYGRVSPLVAARLGRDLFDLVARMGYVEGGFVHRDISPRNVMVRTSRLSLEQQVDEGVFDLYLIDFGSSAESGRAPRRLPARTRCSAAPRPILRRPRCSAMTSRAWPSCANPRRSTCTPRQAWCTSWRAGRHLTIYMRLGKMGRLFRRIARRWPLPRRRR